MDKAWRHLPRVTREFQEGALKFVNNAVKYNEQLRNSNLTNDDSMDDQLFHYITCPCSKCQNLGIHLKGQQVFDHLVCNGMDPTYTNWVLHGEPSSIFDSRHENIEISDTYRMYVDFRGFNRAVGGLVAGVFVIVVIQVAMSCGHVAEPYVIGFSIFLVGAVTSFMKLWPSLVQYEYGFRVVLFTFCLLIVSEFRMGDPIRIAMDRLYSIAIEAFVALFVNVFIFPIWSGEQLHKELVTSFNFVADSLEECVNKYLRDDASLKEHTEFAMDHEFPDEPAFKKCKATLNSSAKLESMVTELDDGIFLGCSLNHVVADGTTFVNLLTTWSEINKNEFEVDLKESKERYLIEEDLIKLPIKLPFKDPKDFIDRLSPQPKLVEKIFHLSSESMAKLKQKANKEIDSNQVSSYQALCSLLWRCMTRARGLLAHQKTSCYVSANNRPRLSPPLPNEFIGCCADAITATTTVCDLLSHSLGSEEDIWWFCKLGFRKKNSVASVLLQRSISEFQHSGLLQFYASSCRLCSVNYRP